VRAAGINYLSNWREPFLSITFIKENVSIGAFRSPVMSPVQSLTTTQRFLILFLKSSIDYVGLGGSLG